MALLHHREAAEILTLAMEHLGDWPIATAERFRNAILGEGYMAVNPLLDMDQEIALSYLRSVIQQTVSEGRMIDFGFIPNSVIKHESAHCRSMFELGELPHPYDTWLGLSSWEGGSCAYHVSPHPIQTDETLMIEIYGVTLPSGVSVVLIYDIVSIKVESVGNTRLSPSFMKFPDGHVQSQLELSNRGANSLDPLVTMLRLLADASVPITHTETPVKLNKARAKIGKFPIPGHSVVHTRDYVAAFTTHRGKHASKGGHHASPIAHWRRAHARHLSSGKIVSVRSSKVNWRDPAELHRMFYHIRK